MDDVYEKFMKILMVIVMIVLVSAIVWGLALITVEKVHEMKMDEMRIEAETSDKWEGEHETD